MAVMRKNKMSRKTAETEIEIEINLDGSGSYNNRTAIGFFDHMLDQLAKHSLIDLSIQAVGDLQIDDHHTVEDVGITLGHAISQALGDKKGIRRYGSCLLPMDDALINASLDLSGRPYLSWKVTFPSQRIGDFDSGLVQEFFKAFSNACGLTLHVESLNGINSHHIAEAIFKAVARALRTALELDPRASTKIPSTKGSL